MVNNASKAFLIGNFLLFSGYTWAEGIVDVKPFISTNINYDDNVFRFSSPEQAKAAFGSSATSDVVKRLEAGVNINLRLSRQIVTLSSSINESRYNRFEILDNTGKSNRLAWNWRVGSDFYGELSISENEAIAGFTEIRQPIKNLRTSTRERASVNWNFLSNWTVNATREHAKSENDLVNFIALDREEDVYETGLRYQNPSGTQLGLAYRVAESKFPNRTGFPQLVFGDESTQKEFAVTAAWLPSPKTRISTRLAHVSLDTKNLPQREFSGFSQRWNLDHSLTSKANINLTAYQEVSPVDDVLSTYVKTKGFSVNPVWNITSNTALRAGIGYEQRDYLGSSLILGTENRNDDSTMANLALIYSPTDKSVVQLQYQGEKRSSNIEDLGYEFNSINFLLRYDF